MVSTKRLLASSEKIRPPQYVSFGRSCKTAGAALAESMASIPETPAVDATAAAEEVARNCRRESRVILDPLLSWIVCGPKMVPSWYWEPSNGGVVCQPITIDSST